MVGKERAQMLTILGHFHWPVSPLLCSLLTRVCKMLCVLLEAALVPLLQTLSAQERHPCGLVSEE